MEVDAVLSDPPVVVSRYEYVVGDAVQVLG